MRSIVSSGIGGGRPLQPSLRIVGLDKRLQARPGNHRIHLCQKLFAPCDLLLDRLAKAGNGRLLGHQRVSFSRYFQTIRSRQKWQVFQTFLNCPITEALLQNSDGMSKPDPICYRTTNWSDYNAVLRRRWSPLIWLDKDMTWHAAIRFGLLITALCKLPLRQTNGTVASSLKMAGLDREV